MWLVNTETLKLEEFTNHLTAGYYEILSHRWRDEELTFQEMQLGRTRKKKAFAKLSIFCRVAREKGTRYVWMDTCCIDKSSSAELSEAINSMYQWYHDSACCIVYLDDVRWSSGDTSRLDGEVPPNRRDRDAFRASEWWSRGWTLQELIAPKELHFYDATWTRIGTRHTLKRLVAGASGISEDVIDMTGGYGHWGGSRFLESLSVAQRMSWAARRQTTRIEDRAYSLMGLFNVNMSPLYGEGPKAFTRLQQEIIRNGNDQSIFAWTSDRPGLHGMLAPDVSYFESCAKVETSASSTSLARPASFQFVNGALSIHLPLYRVPYTDDLFFAFLQSSQLSTAHGDTRSTITLARVSTSHQSTFVRVTSPRIHHVTSAMCSESVGLSSELRPVVTRIDVPEPIILSTSRPERQWGFEVSPASHHVKLCGVNHVVDMKEGLVMPPGVSGAVAGFTFEPVSANSSCKASAFVLGIDSCLNPVIMILSHPRWKMLDQSGELRARAWDRGPGDFHMCMAAGTISAHRTLGGCIPAKHQCMATALLAKDAYGHRRTQGLNACRAIHGRERMQRAQRSLVAHPNVFAWRRRHRRSTARREIGRSKRVHQRSWPEGGRVALHFEAGDVSSPSEWNGPESDWYTHDFHVFPVDRRWVSSPV